MPRKSDIGIQVEIKRTARVYLSSKLVEEALKEYLTILAKGEHNGRRLPTMSDGQLLPKILKPHGDISLSLIMDDEILEGINIEYEFLDE